MAGGLFPRVCGILNENTWPVFSFQGQYQFPGGVSRSAWRGLRGVCALSAERHLLPESRTPSDFMYPKLLRNDIKKRTTPPGPSSHLPVWSPLPRSVFKCAICIFIRRTRLDSSGFILAVGVVVFYATASLEIIKIRQRYIIILHPQLELAIYGRQTKVNLDAAYILQAIYPSARRPASSVPPLGPLSFRPLMSPFPQRHPSILHSRMALCRRLRILFILFTNKFALPRIH